MSDEKPWEDESLKGEYRKAKMFIATRRAAKQSEKPKGLTDAFAPALEEEKRRKKFGRFSKLADLMPGQRGK